MTKHAFSAILHKKEEGIYVGECAEVGTVGHRPTVEEAIENLKETTELYLEEFPLTEMSRARVTTFETAHA
jgi:predicted RNase H-like HicB family nuclease